MALLTPETLARWRRSLQLSALAPAAQRTGAASLQVSPTRARLLVAGRLVGTLVETLAGWMGLVRSRG